MGVDPMLARLRPLPVRLRIAHLAALVRWERAKHARSLLSLPLRRWKDYFARRFQECLDRLALIYGFATKAR
jgi:hypothetical protein